MWESSTVELLVHVEPTEFTVFAVFCEFDELTELRVAVTQR